MKLTLVPRSRVLVAVAIAAASAVCVRSGLGGEGLLCLAPALVLALVLLGRRYPGERLLYELARTGRRRGRSPAVGLRPPPAIADARVPRGGLLMACALAVRPPPPAPLAS